MASADMHELFGSDEDEDDVEIPEAIIGDDNQDDTEQFPAEKLSFPHIISVPNDTKLCSLKLINVIGCETRPFDPDTFQPIPDDNSTEARKASMRNPIRWRLVTNEQGQLQKDSNARFVRWDDGSLQLFVGKEVFDVTEQDSSKQNFFVYVRHQGLMRSQGIISEKLTLRPCVGVSNTRLNHAIAKKNVFRSRVKMVSAKIDPEERSNERIGDSRRRKSKLSKSSILTDDFLEHDDDDDEVSGSHKRKKHVNDDEERDRKISNAKRGAVATTLRKKPKQEEDDEEESEAIETDSDQGGGGDIGDNGDDDDAETGDLGKGARKRVVVSDGDDDDDDDDE